LFRANTCLATHVLNLDMDVILPKSFLPNTSVSDAEKPERKRYRAESSTPPQNVVRRKVSSVEMSSYQGLDAILKNWHFDPHSLSVRLVKGEVGRDVIQMRVDLGVLQMETNGRPDGQEMDGNQTFLDALLEAEKGDPEFVMSEKQCFEADREFVQFYHRRISWLRLEHYHRAVEDADHTLALMDVCRDHSPEEEWTMSHEQYRPFVLFHRTQAAALASLDDSSPDDAVKEINQGLDAVRAVFEEHEATDEFESDEMVQQLIRLRESIRNEYEVGESLQERLATAVREEQYELAAKLRDELARKQAH
ncbi:MAG: UvrB/UvrC motif-containing protein, partial [Pirellula sp.]